MFLLIGHSNRVRRSEAISIHLMFLLISGQRMHYRIKSNYFNTSHVSINRKSGGQDHSRRNFNTSHVSINHRFFKADCSILYISIHLMFLLIEYLEAQGDPQKNFNTSHVSINLFRAGCPCTTNFNFNTSHVSINQFQA